MFCGAFGLLALSILVISSFNSFEKSGDYINYLGIIMI